MYSSQIKLLSFIPEPLPTHRPDVCVLFGKELPRHGIDTMLVGCGSTADGANGKISSSEVVVTANKGKIALYSRYIWTAFSLSLKAKKNGFSVIQVRDMVWVGLIVAVISKIIRLPFFYWMSFLLAESRIERAKNLDENMGCLKRPLLFLKGFLERKILYRCILPLSSGVFVQSNAMKRMVVDLGIPEDKIYPVPMGVDFQKIEKFYSTDPKFIPEWKNNPVVCYLGTLDRLRNLDVLLHGFALTRKEYPDLRLLFIGDTDVEADRNFLLDRAREFGIEEAFKITGWLPVNEAWALLKSSQFAVSHVPRSSLFDVSSPTKPLEYIALGIPLIVNDSPDQHDLVKATGCGLVVDGTPHSYAKSFMKMLSVSKNKWPFLSGRQYIRNFRSYEVLSREVAAIYRKYTDVKS